MCCSFFLSAVDQVLVSILILMSVSSVVRSVSYSILFSSSVAEEVDVDSLEAVGIEAITVVNSKYLNKSMYSFHFPSIYSLGSVYE